MLRPAPLLTRLALTLVFLLGLAAPAPAAAPGVRDVEGSLIEELIVSAPPLGGPAFWTVSNGPSKVYVLGVPNALPGGLRWDSRKLEARLKGANVLILPPSFRANPVKAVFFFLTNQKRFQQGQPLESTLPEPLRGRFIAARTALNKPADRYAKWKPAAAGLFLSQDFRGPLRMKMGEPEGWVRHEGRSAGVREQRVASYDVLPLMKTMATMPDEAHRACLADTLSEIEAGRGRVQAAADGWARGDVRAALTAERGYDRCLTMIPAISALTERSMADTANVIAAALAKPGKAVAVVELRQLLARGGVLDRLRTRGYQIQTPADRTNAVGQYG